MDNSKSCGNAIQFILSMVTTIGFFGSLATLFFFQFPDQNRDLINTMIGSLGTIWILQMNYFYSSSSTSKLKDQTIASIVNSSQPTQQQPIKTDTVTMSTSTNQ